MCDLCDGSMWSPVVKMKNGEIWKGISGRSHALQDTINKDIEVEYHLDPVSDQDAIERIDFFANVETEAVERCPRCWKLQFPQEHEKA